MHIYIPSMSRAGLVRTWAALPMPWRAKAALVVPTKQEKAYRAAGHSAVLPCPVKGIGATRQWIMERHKSGTVLMLDDDLEFFSRRVDDPTKVVKADEDSMKRLMTTIDMVGSQYAHGGVSTREGCNRNTEFLVMNDRCLRALFYDAKVFHKLKLRFDRVPVMEDFDVALQLLRKGYDSARVNKWVQDQPGSNTTGGCSDYRTMDVQAKGAKGLAKLHPDFVTVVEKPPLKSGGWSGQARTDVRIAWKKARASHV